VFLRQNQDVFAARDSFKNRLADKFYRIFNPVLAQIVKSGREQIGVHDRYLKPCIADINGRV
jgi:hypothetical protein